MGRPMYATIGCLGDQGYQGELLRVSYGASPYGRARCTFVARRNSSQEQEQATEFTTTLPYQIMFDSFGGCLKVVYPVSLIPTDFHNVLQFQTNPCVPWATQAPPSSSRRI